MSVSTGVIQIVIKDDGNPSAPPTSRPSGPPQPSPSFSSPIRPPAPTAPPTIITPKVEMPSASPVIPEVKPAAVASIDQMIRELLADKGIRQSLGNPTAEQMAKNNPTYIAELYKQLRPEPQERAAAPAAMPPTPAGVAVAEQIKSLIGQLKQSQKAAESPVNFAPVIDQLKEANETLKALDEAMRSEVPAPDIYPFKDAKDRLEAGPTYKVQPAEERPASPLPRAVPVPQRPVAQPISDAEKSREQWSPAGLVGDLKNYLPNSIGKKLGDMQAAYSAASKQAAAGGAGTMGQMAAGASEAMIAAGPVATLAAAEVGSRVLAGTINKFTHAVDTASTGMQQLAGNDAMGAFKTAVDYTADSLSEIPIVGKVYAAELQATIAPIRALHDTTAAFVARGKELAAFNGPLAGANAQAEVRSIMADLREAEQLGPSLARLTDAQSRADSEIRELLLPVKEFVINKLAAAIEIGIAAWDVMRPFFETVGNAVFAGLDILQQIAEMVSKVIPGAGGFAEVIKKIIDEARKRPVVDEEDPERVFMGWLNAADNLGRGAPIGRNGDDEARRKIAGPVFPGFAQALGM